jgi:hypothetical protein
LPVIASNSTIPKWVLAFVPASRDRNGFLKRLYNGGLVRIALCAYFSDLKKINFVIANLSLWNLLQLAAFSAIAVVTVKSLFDGWRAYKWLDEHQKWSEVAQLQWYEPVATRKISGWITAAVFLLLGVGIVLYWNSVAKP